MSWLMQSSLLDGWLPFAVDVTAAVIVIFGIPWRHRPLWQWVVLGGGLLSLTALANWIVDLPPRVGGTYPPSFLAWAAAPVFVAIAFAVHWNGSEHWRRAVAVLAVPVVAAFGLLQIDAHYQYVRTVGGLLGEPVQGQIDAARLVRPIRAVPRTPPHLQRRMRPTVVAVPKRGVVAQIDIPSTRSHFEHRDAYVWLPPAYFERPTPHLSVFMLISGTPGTTADWIRAGGALDVLNGWAATHDGMAPAVVFPDANGSAFADTECVDGPAGAAETYLTEDVPAFMHARFGIATGSQRWAIGGLSEGGTCALDLAARHPRLFSTFSDYSGDAAPTLGSTRVTVQHLYAGSWGAWRAHDPARWFARDAYDGLAGCVTVGSADVGHVRVERRVMREARAAGLPVRSLVVPGGHDFEAFSTALRETFPWIASRLENRAPSMPGPTRPAVRPSPV